MRKVYQGPGVPRPCNGCDVSVILAFNPLTTHWRAFEAAERIPWSNESAGCYVIIHGQAWRPIDYVEDVRVRNELTEEKAKELAAGWPWHRPHFHPKTEETS